MNSSKQTDIIRNIRKRLAILEKNSHPPVNWKELIYSNIERIERLEMDTHEFMEILKHLVEEKRELQSRLDIMEEILHSYIPEIGNDDKK